VAPKPARTPHRPASTRFRRPRWPHESYRPRNRSSGGPSFGSIAFRGLVALTVPRGRRSARLRGAF
jgi:hypothetical protein